MTAKSVALRTGVMIAAIGFFFYLASFGAAVAKAGFGADGSWFNLMRSDRIDFAQEKLPSYAPVFWVCKNCSPFNKVMSNYVGMCYDLYMLAK